MSIAYFVRFSLLLSVFHPDFLFVLGLGVAKKNSKMRENTLNKPIQLDMVIYRSIPSKKQLKLRHHEVGVEQSVPIRVQERQELRPLFAS